MKLVSPLLGLVMLSAVLPAQAQELQNIYRVSGVTDSGEATNIGVATAIHCSNPRDGTEKVRIIIRDFNGSIAGNHDVQIPARRTITAVTHNTVIFEEDETLSPGNIINQGSAQIQASSLLVHCSAMIVDAAATVPQGIALHMVRYNPLNDTTE